MQKPNIGSTNARTLLVRTVFVRSKSELLLSLHTRLKYYDTCATQTKILNLDGTPPPESSCLSRLLCSSPLPFQMRSSLEREVSLSLLLDDRINENTGARQWEVCGTVIFLSLWHGLAQNVCLMQRGHKRIITLLKYDTAMYQQSKMRRTLLLCRLRTYNIYYHKCHLFSKNLSSIRTKMH